MVRKNLRELKLNLQWVEKEIKKAGATSIHDVFYAEIQTDGTLHVDFRTDKG